MVPYIVMPKLGITLFLTGRHDHIYIYTYIHSYLGIPKPAFLVVGKVWVNSREEKMTWNSFTCVSQHMCIEIYLFSHKLIYLSSAKKCLFNFIVCLIVFIQFDKLSYNGLRNSTYIYYIRAVGKTTPSIVFIVIYNKIYKKVNDDRKLNKLLDS